MVALCDAHFECISNRGKHEECKTCQKRLDCISLPSKLFKHFPPGPGFIFICQFCGKESPDFPIYLDPVEEERYQAGERIFHDRGIGIRLA